MSKNISIAFDRFQVFINRLADSELPMPNYPFVSLVELCVDSVQLEFAREEYRLVSDLAMGSLLIALLGSS